MAYVGDDNHPEQQEEIRANVWECWNEKPE